MKRYIKPFEILQPDKIPEKVDDLDEIVDVKVSKLQLIRINRLLQNYNKHQEEARKKIKVEIKRMIISLIAISLAAVGGLSAIILHLKNSSCKTKCCSCLFQEKQKHQHHNRKENDNDDCPTN